MHRPLKKNLQSARGRHRGIGSEGEVAPQITLFSLVGHFSVAKFGSMYILNIENFHCMFLDVF